MPSLAEVPEVESYELHFLLDASKLLDDNYAVNSTYAQKYGLKDKSKFYGLYYLDTVNQGFL